MPDIEEQPKLARNNSIESYDDILISRYFCKRGEGLPQHTHESKTQHVTIVAAGSIWVRGSGIDRVVKAGELFDFGKDQLTHSIMALEDNTIFFNVQKRLDV